jgi:hypothetical protein
MESNPATAENLHHVIDNLKIQAEASKYWKCPFSGCTKQVIRSALPDLEALVSSLQSSHDELSSGKHKGASRQTLQLTIDLAKITCATHQLHVNRLEFFHKPVQQVEKAVVNYPNDTLSPSTPVKQTSKHGTQPGYPRQAGTSETLDDTGYFTASDRKTGKGMRSPGIDSLSSPDSPGAEGIFDEDTPNVKVDTPDTIYSFRETSRTSRILFPGKQTNPTETPTKVYEPRLTLQSGADEDNAEPARTTICVVAEEGTYASENEEDDSSSYIEIHSCSCAKADRGSNASKDKVQTVEKFNPGLKIDSKPVEAFFRARALLHDALNKNYVNRDKLPGKIYVAIDIRDPTLKNLFKVGMVQESNTVSERYKNSSCKRKENMRFVAISNDVIEGAYRVEKLVHRELYAYRKRFNCRHCGTSHTEWFKADLDIVVDAINRWTMFVELVRLNGDDEAQLTQKVKEFMMKGYDLHGFVESFISHSGYTANPKEMVTFVKNKENLKKDSKDIDALTEWETTSANDLGQLSRTISAGAKKQEAEVRADALPQDTAGSRRVQGTIARRAQQAMDVLKNASRRKQGVQ